MAVTPERYTTSRIKIGLYLAIDVGLVALCADSLVHPSGRPGHLWLWLPTGFFGLASFVCAWLLLRPQVLSLDQEGFTLAGGLIRKPRKTAWRDIDLFFVYSLPRGGGAMVGYNYLPEKRPTTALTSLSHSMGVDGALPKGWSLPPVEMVDRLNAYRRDALGG